MAKRNTKKVNAEQIKIKISWWQIAAGILTFLFGSGIIFNSWNEFKEFRDRKAHISVALEMKQEGEALQKNALPIIIKSTITNPGKRPIHIFASIFMVYGHKLTDETVKQDYDISIKFEKESKNQRPFIVFENLPSSKQNKIIAAGQMFDGWRLEPQETASKQMVLFIPKGEFDFLSFQTEYVTFYDKDGIKGGYQLKTKDAQNNNAPSEKKVVRELEIKTESGKWREIASYSESEIDKLSKERGYGLFESVTSIPLHN